jgi:hypothetical protein
VQVLAIDAGIFLWHYAGMTVAMKKITAFVPVKALAGAQAQTGAGVSETLRIALEKVAREGFYQRLQELRGKMDFSGFDLDELREDKTYDDKGDVNQ